MERYSISPHMHSECGKIQAEVTLNEDTFYAVYSLNCLLPHSFWGLYNIFWGVAIWYEKVMGESECISFPVISLAYQYVVHALLRIKRTIFKRNYKWNH